MDSQMMYLALLIGGFGAVLAWIGERIDRKRPALESDTPPDSHDSRTANSPA